MGAQQRLSNAHRAYPGTVYACHAEQGVTEGQEGSFSEEAVGATAIHPSASHVPRDLKLCRSSFDFCILLFRIFGQRRRRSLRFLVVVGCGVRT